MPDKDQPTEVARRRWNRTARGYDVMEVVIEKLWARKWRPLLWSKVEGTHILEIGVGTGKNFPYYPVGAEITAIDFSSKMLERARDKANNQNVTVYLREMDLQNLEFADNTFDTVAGSAVFCCVPDPVRGIAEVERVCKPGGKVILLEHDLRANRILGWIANIANPLLVRMIGSNFNRRAVDNLTRNGLTLEKVTNLNAGIAKLIEARKRTPHS